VPWVLEFNTFMFSTFVWIGLSISFKENSQVSLTIFTDLLPEKARKQFSVIQMLISGIYLICIGLLAFEYLIYFYSYNINTPAMKAPMYIMRSPLVIGCAFSLYRLVERLVSLAKKWAHT
ncbi:MAG: TRAP transporter small permease subunit, partial [Actinobacteria bacterium]|nr:TRAP transporter small permease subunit [Actinomycetota bacterium]